MTGEPKKRSEHEREPDEYEPGNASTERALSNELMRTHTFKTMNAKVLFVRQLMSKAALACLLVSELGQARGPVGRMASDTRTNLRSLQARLRRRESRVGRGTKTPPCCSLRSQLPSPQGHKGEGKKKKLGLLRHCRTGKHRSAIS